MKALAMSGQHDSAGEGTIQINQSLTHQSRPASSHVQQSFASAFRRDRSVGPKRTGKLAYSPDLLLCLSHTTMHNTDKDINCMVSLPSEGGCSGRHTAEAWTVSSVC